MEGFLISRPFSSLRNEKKIQALGRLICFAKEQSSVISNEDFRIILREVIQTVEDTSVSKIDIDYYYFNILIMNYSFDFLILV